MCVNKGDPRVPTDNGLFVRSSIALDCIINENKIELCIRQRIILKIMLNIFIVYCDQRLLYQKEFVRTNASTYICWWMCLQHSSNPKILQMNPASLDAFLLFHFLRPFVSFSSLEVAV
jgi:hypothetical protein